MDLGEIFGGILVLLEFYAWYWLGASLLYGYAMPAHVAVILILTVLALVIAWSWLIGRGIVALAKKRKRRLGMVRITRSGAIYYTNK